MNPERTVLVVGGKLKIVQKARALGLDVIYLQRPDDFHAEYAALVQGALLLDYTDWRVVRPIVQAAHEAFGFRAAVSLTEFGLEPASLICDLLGLEGNPFEVSHRLLDKWEMRRHLAQAGGPVVAAAVVEAPESMREFGRKHGYPLIVKPARGTASFGVMRLECASDVDDAWRRIGALQADRDRRHVDRGGFVVEEYVDGPEYSVEAFTFSGRHVVIAVTEKETLGAVEIRHAMPARLEPGVERNIVDCVTRFLDTIGLRHGPSHTELRVGPAGPRIIESHNRVGGDRISELVHAAYGIDLNTYAVGWPFRLVDELTQRPAPLQAAATRFLSGRPGVVTAVDGADEVLAHPDVVALDVTVVPGDELRPLADSWDRPGQVVVTGRSTGEAIATCEDLARRIRLTTRADATRVPRPTAPQK